MHPNQVGLLPGLLLPHSDCLAGRCPLVRFHSCFPPFMHDKCTVFPQYINQPIYDKGYNRICLDCSLCIFSSVFKTIRKPSLPYLLVRKILPLWVRLSFQPFLPPGFPLPFLVSLRKLLFRLSEPRKV